MGDRAADEPEVRSVFDGTAPVDWTTSDTVAFEVARDVLADIIAVVSGDLADVRRAGGDPGRVDELTALRARYLAEQACLRPDDRAEVARIRGDYGAQLRDRHATNHG